MDQIYENWIYERTPDNTARFILGTVGKNPLVCIGINPSTAEPNNLDNTVKRVENMAIARGHDCFTMLNVYPQRATNPNDLHPTHCPNLQALNEQHIAQFVNGRPLTIWAAWGNLITKRPYLQGALRTIANLPALANCQWINIGDLTKSGHPRHPLYVKNDTPFMPFDIIAYKGGK